MANLWNEIAELADFNKVSVVFPLAGIIGGFRGIISFLHSVRKNRDKKHAKVKSLWSGFHQQISSDFFFFLKNLV